MLPLHLSGRQLSLPRSQSHSPAAEGARGRGAEPGAAAGLSRLSRRGRPADTQLLGAAGRGGRREAPGPAPCGEAEPAAAGAAPSLHALARRKVAGSPHSSAPAAALTHRGCWRRARRRGSLSAGGGRGRLSRAMPSPHYIPWLVPAERPATSARRGCPCFLRPAGTAAAPPGCAARSGASTAGVPGHGGSAEGEGGRGRREPPAALPEGRRRWARESSGNFQGWRRRGSRAPLPPPARAGGTFSPAGAPLAASAASSPGRAARCPASPAGGSAEGLRVPQVERDESRRLLLTLPAASRKLAGRHPRPSAAVPGSAARPSQSVCVSPPLPRSNQKPGGSGVMFAAPS